MSSSEIDEEIGVIVSADEMDDNFVLQEKQPNLKMGPTIIKTPKVGGKTPRCKPTKTPLVVSIHPEHGNGVQYIK